jgi:NodT family efflux transporter outer membrane factor (OMF) lipoprotein
MICRSVFLLALLAGISACASKPLMPSADVPLPATWPAPLVSDAPALVQADWWTQLNDPVLNQIVADALRDNPTLGQALARMNTADAEAKAAVARLLPEINADGQVPFEKQLDGPAIGATRTQGQFRGGPSISWELDLFGRNRNALTAARANAQALAGDAEAARISLVAAIVEAYVDLRAAQTQLDLVSRSVETQSRLARLVEMRANAGIASQFDFNRTRIGLNQALAQKPVAELSASIAAQRLATLAGRAEPESSWMASAPLPNLAGFSLDVAPADLLRLRPDVRAAEARVRVASAQVGIAESDLYPRLTLGGSITVSANVTGSAVPGTTTVGSLTPALSMPLFDWGSRVNTVRARQNDLVAAIYGYRGTVLDAYAEANNALVQVVRQDERARQLDAARQAAAAALRQSVVLYEQGLTGLTERLDAETNALQTDLDAIASRQAAAQAVISLHKALGSKPTGL